MSVTPSPPLPPCPLSSHLPLVHVIGHIQVIVATNRSPTPAPPVPIEEARKYKGGREGGKEDSPSTSEATPTSATPHIVKT